MALGKQELCRLETGTCLGLRKSWGGGSAQGIKRSKEQTALTSGRGDLPPCRWGDGGPQSGEVCCLRVQTRALRSGSAKNKTLFSGWALSPSQLTMVVLSIPYLTPPRAPHIQLLEENQMSSLCYFPHLYFALGRCNTSISTCEPYPSPPPSSHLPAATSLQQWPLACGWAQLPHYSRLFPTNENSRANCLMRPIFCCELLIKEQTQPTINLVLGKKLGLQQTEENN